MHERRRPVLEAAQRLHAPVDDGDLERPEERRSTATASTGSRRSAPAFAPAAADELAERGRRSPGRRSRSGCRTSRRPRPPGSAPGGWRRAARRRRGRSTGNGMPYFGPAWPVSSIGSSTIMLAEGDGEDGLLPVHAERDQAGGEGPAEGCCAPCRSTAPRSCTSSSCARRPGRDAGPRWRRGCRRGRPRGRARPGRRRGWTGRSAVSRGSGFGHGQANQGRRERPCGRPWGVRTVGGPRGRPRPSAEGRGSHRRP